MFKRALIRSKMRVLIKNTTQISIINFQSTTTIQNRFLIENPITKDLMRKKRRMIFAY